MSRNRRLGLFIFSLILWIQLVLAAGLMVWRFWSISTGDSEVFVGVGPAVRTADLVDSVREHCSNDLLIGLLSETL